MITEKISDPHQQMVSIAKQELSKRKRQTKMLPGVFTSNPALTMLLELYVAEAEQAQSQTIYLIEAVGLPRATGLRWLKIMAEIGFVRRMIHEQDRRSKYVELTKSGRAIMEDYLIACDQIDECPENE